MYYLVQLFQLLIPISICVVLPVLIVWIVFRASTNKHNKNAEVIIKAIENNSTIDTDKIIEALSHGQKTPIEILNGRLLRGCIFTLIGISAIVVAIISGYMSIPEQIIQFPALIISGLSLAIGIAYLVVYFVSRKSIKNYTGSND